MSPRKSTASVEKFFKHSKTPQRLSKSRTSMKPSFESLEDEVLAVLNQFRSSIPDCLPGRDEQIDKLDRLLRDCIDFKHSCTVYVFGAPGRGKTASMKLLTNRAYIKNNMNVVHVDCRKLITATEIYKEIISSLNSRCKLNPKMLNITKIRRLIEASEKPTLIIMDEMDRLKTRTNSVLYSLFELRKTVSAGKIAIIGIGNEFNFIEKLPLVRNDGNLKPTLIPFSSYSKDEIKAIITDRLNSVAPQRLVFTDTAVELLAAKTAEFGDARVSLGLAIAAVSESFKKADGDDICKVDPFTVIKVYNAAYGFNQANAEGNDTIDRLPLPQKLIICAVAIILKKKLCEVKDLTVTRVYEEYRKASTSKGIEILNQNDFLLACRMVENQGFITRKKKNKKSNLWDDKVVLKWDGAYLIETLTSKPLLSDILNS